MSLKIDSRQLYLQVVDELKRKIKGGVFAENQKLPSEYNLSKQLGVSRATLREALRALEEEHIVTRRHGVGTFVNPTPTVTSGIEELKTVTDMIIQSGKTPGSQYISAEIIQATREDRERFSSNLVELAKIERVRTADEAPVVYCVDMVPVGLFPLEELREQGSIFAAIEKHTSKQIAYAVTYIEPVSYHDRIFNILNCDPNQSLLLLKQMHYTTDDEAILYSANYFRSDTFSFHVLRKRV
ncbi:GntR family transcriptional regulator [Oceanobacillus sp. CAU 1775]